jgi:aminoglycoside phosphotransferase (APT) family kinase protein
LKLPDSVPVSADALAAIAIRHNIDTSACEPCSTAGIINSVYFLGETLVLRVPRNHPAHVDQARREAKAIPLAVAAGVHTPRLIAFDDARDILPVPYLIVERIHGVSFESLSREPEELPKVWRALGQDLARLHRGVKLNECSDLPSGWGEGLADPRHLVEERVADGWLSPIEARWLLRWLERLATCATGTLSRRFCHADVQMTNVLVDPNSQAYLASIDWGCAHWVDPAFDFLAMPLGAIPLILAGYREVACDGADDLTEARILWRRLQLLLSTLPRGTAKDCSWGERPIAWLVDLFRFFLDQTDERWRAIAPSQHEVQIGLR